MATETAYLYLVNSGTPNAQKTALTTSWSLLLVDKLHPERATLHSLGACRTQHELMSEARRLRNSTWYNRTGFSNNGSQMMLSSSMMINLVKYAQLAGSSPSVLLENLIKKAIPLSSIFPPPPPDSFDSFDPDFDSKRGILSPGSALLSYYHLGTFTQECNKAAFENFRQILSNSLSAVLDQASCYPRGASTKDFELWMTQEWAVRAVKGVRCSFKFDLSSGFPSFDNGPAPVKQHLVKALDTCMANLA
ncbi:hypothetical protein MD484_g4653, partial [Candolleomyces efflorescens]